MYYTERKPKNENGGGLGTRLHKLAGFPTQIYPKDKVNRFSRNYMAALHNGQSVVVCARNTLRCKVVQVGMLSAAGYSRVNLYDKV